MTQYDISSLALDPVVNFGKVTVSTGYTTETAIALLTGHGTRLPDPSPSVDGPFNLVWYNSSKYADPADDPNVEIVRCTIKAVDSIVVARGQENTSISNKNSVGDTYKMILAPTKKMFTDIPIDTQSRVNSSVSAHAALTTGIHGAGASTIETITGSQAKVDTHKDLTTGVHGAGVSTIETIAGSQSKVNTHAALTTAHGSNGTVVGLTDANASYAPIAKGITNGDSHDHNGGDGAQINHTTLSNIGTNTHATIDTHLVAAAPHTGHARNIVPTITGSANWTNPTEVFSDTGASIGPVTGTLSLDCGALIRGTVGGRVIASNSTDDTVVLDISIDGATWQRVATSSYGTPVDGSYFGLFRYIRFIHTYVNVSGTYYAKRLVVIGV